jgi:hypothetical protein
MQLLASVCTEKARTGLVSYLLREMSDEQLLRVLASDLKARTTR